MIEPFTVITARSEVQPVSRSNLPHTHATNNDAVDHFWHNHETGFRDGVLEMVVGHHCCFSLC